MTTITTRTAKRTDGTSRFRVSSPYHPEFPARARELGGTWIADRKEWSFDLRDEARVRDLLRTVYAADGSEDASDLVAVRVDLDHAASTDRLLGLGRELAHRWSRDERVRLGAGVVVVAGGFPGSGGSRNHPRLAPQAGTILEVRDVPRAIAEREASASSNLFRIT